MASRRKTSKSSAPKRARASAASTPAKKRRAGMRTLPIPPARAKRRSSPPPKRRVAKKASPPRRARDEVVTRRPSEQAAERPGRSPLHMDEVLEGDTAAEVAAADFAEGRRYMAVAEVPGAGSGSDAGTLSPSGGGVSRPEVHRYSTDVPIAAISLLLAVTTFLPWYHGPKGFGLSVSGWSSGTWGPLIFFLALGSLAFVGLRRAGVVVGLPVEESLLHEGAGWISLVGAVIKMRFRPGTGGILAASFGVWIAIALAAGLIVLAGRMSPHAPFVVRPGWHKGRAGVIGIAVLSVVVAGSAVFGMTNSASLAPSARDQDVFGGTVRGKLPDCAKGFPLPVGVKPDYGFGTGAACQAQLTSTKAPAALTKEFRTLLTAKKYVYKTLVGQPGSTVFTITKPKCATLAVVPGQTGSIVALSITKTCVAPTPRRS